MSPMQHTAPETVNTHAHASNDRLQSYWMAGFEGADHIDLRGMPLDMVACTGHADQLEGDYQRAAALGLTTVRESVGWRVCCPQTWRHRDFTRMLRAADAAATHGVQVLWTLMHYGTPPDVRICDPDFAQHFAEFAADAAQHLRQHIGVASIYNPINEIGFLAWAMAGSHTVGGECTDRDGYSVKSRLVQAALRGIDAISAADSGAKFMHIEPLIHVVAPADQPAFAQAAADFCGYQWQVWDMLSGRIAPELGGTLAAIDWIGVNHYHDAQWEIGTGQRLDWHTSDPRRLPFCELLQQAWHRYGVPLVVAETSHFGEGRSRWLDDIAAQTQQAMQRGVPVEGICLYPAVDRPGWNNLTHWHRSGLWDAIAPDSDDAAAAAPMARRLAADYAAALRRWQKRMGLQHGVRAHRVLSPIR